MYTLKKIALAMTLGGILFSCTKELDVTPEVASDQPSTNSVLKSTTISLDCLIGDINGDGKDDILKTTGNGWYVSYSATGAWIKICNSSNLKNQILAADINNDGMGDILCPMSAGFDGPGWYVDYDSNNGWVKINSNL